MQLTKALILSAIEDGTIVGDGHTIYGPEMYAPHFDVVEMGLMRTHHSDGSHKGSIYGNDGTVMESLEGVYNLAFLNRLIGMLDLPFPTAAGRGFQAQQAVDTLKQWAMSEG